MNSVTIRQLEKSSVLRVGNVGRVPEWTAKLGLAVLCVTFGIGLWLSVGLQRLMHAYLLNVSFFLSISLGALFFVLLQHLTGARWSVVIRRIAELLTSALPTLGLLMLPVIVPMLFGSAQLYSWNDETLRASDLLIQGKAPYLNAPFFALRCLLYFAVWIAIARYYHRQSLLQETTTDHTPSASMRAWSGPSMIAFAATINFAAFDWLMSLDPHWFSTIFGIYFFAGCAMAVFASLIIVASLLQRYGFVNEIITTDHYHDLGKMLFGFMFFWAYIAFSQFLLIWYANIPEETVWFLHRQQHGWQNIGLLLIAGHFALPFFGLMSRSARRSRRILLFWSTFLLVMHWVDLCWLIMPNASPEKVSIGQWEAMMLVGVGAIWVASMLRQAEGTSLVPTGDPHLSESLALHNI